MDRAYECDLLPCASRAWLGEFGELPPRFSTCTVPSGCRLLRLRTAVAYVLAVCSVSHAHQRGCLAGPCTAGGLVLFGKPPVVRCAEGSLPRRSCCYRLSYRHSDDDVRRHALIDRGTNPQRLAHSFRRANRLSEVGLHKAVGSCAPLPRRLTSVVHLEDAPPYWTGLPCCTVAVFGRGRGSLHEHTQHVLVPIPHRVSLLACGRSCVGDGVGMGCDENEPRCSSQDYGWCAARVSARNKLYVRNVQPV